MKTDEKGLRKCLKCDVNFVSEGAHNRLCHRCSYENSIIPYLMRSLNADNRDFHGNRRLGQITKEK